MNEVNEKESLREVAERVVADMYGRHVIPAVIRVFATQECLKRVVVAERGEVTQFRPVIERLVGDALADVEQQETHHER